jgi:hypothetical protein
MSRRKPRLKDIGFKPNYRTKAQKLMLLLKMLKKMVQVPKAPISLQISPRSAFSRYSNISKKKEWMKTFLDSLDNCSDEDEDEEKN